MNKDKTKSRQNVFFQINNKHTTRRRIEKWIKEINQLNTKSIYNLTWNSFYKELLKLGIKEFLKQYGYSCKRQLQLTIAKSELWQREITLTDFEKSTEQELLVRLGNSFFDKITRQPNFNAKNHPLSTIHYYMYHYSLHFTAISLGFASKQYFLNFFAQTQYVPECVENLAQNLRATILSLCEADPVTLRKELADIYDNPLAVNKNFLKYNFTLEELKLALENEDTILVIASLGGGNAHYVNKKLQTLRPMVNVCLQDLKERSWKELMVNTPILLWKIKLYQLFSNQLALDHWPATLYIPRPIHRSCMNYYWRFFTSQQAQSHTDTPLDHPSCASFYSTELVVSERLSACTFTA